jgi:hypothetical protein
MAAVDFDVLRWYEPIPQLFKILAAPGCSWLLLAAPGCSWLLLAGPRIMQYRLFLGPGVAAGLLHPGCYAPCGMRDLYFL